MWRNLCPSQFVTEIVTDKSYLWRKYRACEDREICDGWCEIFRHNSEISPRLWRIRHNPSQNENICHGLWRVHHNPFNFFFSVLIERRVIFSFHARHFASALHLPGEPNPPHTPTPAIYSTTASLWAARTETGAAADMERTGGAVNFQAQPSSWGSRVERIRRRQGPARQWGTVCGGELGKATAGEQCTVGQP